MVKTRLQNSPHLCIGLRSLCHITITHIYITLEPKSQMPLPTFFVFSETSNMQIPVDTADNMSTELFAIFL